MVAGDEANSSYARYANDGGTYSYKSSRRSGGGASYGGGYEYQARSTYSPMSGAAAEALAWSREVLATVDEAQAKREAMTPLQRLLAKNGDWG